MVSELELDSLDAEDLHDEPAATISFSTMAASPNYYMGTCSYV